MKLFEFNNSNRDAMCVPSEQGEKTEDSYNSSIGDATMKHVLSLDHNQRQMWEGLIHMRSGAVFRSTPSTEQFDPDPFGLRGKDLQKYVSKLKTSRKYFDAETGEEKVTRGLTDKEIEPFMEAIEAEAQRQEESEDVFDHGNLIPFDDWEKMPQQWAHIEMPSTPKDRFIFMGNTNQLFYDAFPEGHPDTKLINNIFSMVNRHDIDLDDNYAEWIKEKVILTTECQASTAAHLTAMIDRLATYKEDPNEVAEFALASIDRDWSVSIRDRVFDKMAQDPVFQLILHNEKEWEEQNKQGKSVYASVKAFGQALFKDKELKELTRGWHWHQYRSLKKKYAPKVICRGMDVNRCRIKELMSSLNLTRSGAEKVWFARPFESLGEIYMKDLINRSSFSDSEVTDKICSLMEKRAADAEEEKDLKRFSPVRHLLMSWQRDKEHNLVPSQWRMLWEFFRLRKVQIQETIKEQA